MAMARAAFNEKTPFTSKLDLYLRKKLVKCYILSVVLYGVETWTLHKGDQEILENFEIWCWRRMEKISWTDRVRNEVLQEVNDESNKLQTIRKKAKCIAHILSRNCLLKCVIERKMEGRTEVTGRHRRIHKQLLNDLKETTDYWKLKSHTLWAAGCGRVYGNVVKQTMELIKWNIQKSVCYLVVGFSLPSQK
jgi:hypothetical protein